MKRKRDNNKGVLLEEYEKAFRIKRAERLIILYNEMIRVLCLKVMKKNFFSSLVLIKSNSLLQNTRLIYDLIYNDANFIREKNVSKRN